METVLIFSGLAALTACAAYGSLCPNPGRPDQLQAVRHRFRWPFLVTLVILGGIIWDRQSVIDHTCAAMHRAMDFDAGGQSDPKTLDFQASVKLMTAVPGFKDAVKVCYAT